MGVQVIIVIEDNVRYYSSFLPVIYTELMHHSQRLAPEGVNPSHRLMRMQARPKILLCRTFEEAWQAFSAYPENVLGVISDIEFPMDGVMAPDGGRGVRAARARGAAGRPGHAAVERARERGARRGGRRRVPAQGLAARCCTSCAGS